MKFFPGLALCWGGATVSPAAETSGGGWRQEEEEQWPRNYSHEHATSGVRKVKSSKHWKPNLHAISEDRPIYDETQPTVRSDRKSRPRKVKPKPAPSHSDNYWKYLSYPMALPAFSPTPFII